MEKEIFEKAVRLSEKEDTAPVLKGGCYSLTTTNTKKWYDLLANYYYDKVDEEDENEQVTWDDRNQSTLIKYSRTDRNLSITITLHNTGTLTVQGSQKSRDIWINEHYPELIKLRVILMLNGNKRGS